MSDFLSIVSSTLYSLVALDIFPWLIGSIVFAGVIGLVIRLFVWR